MKRLAPAARGMALLEVLVAVAIFAVVAAIAYRGIATVTRARAAIAAESERLGRLQLAIALIERDLRQAVPRSVRGGYGETLPALVGDARTLELTSAAFASPFAERRPQLARLTYSLDRRALTRQAHESLDRGNAAPRPPATLLDAVDAVRWRYLGTDPAWRDEWPPRQDRSAMAERLPRAVELTLTLADYGTIRRVVPLVETPSTPARGPSS